MDMKSGLHILTNWFNDYVNGFTSDDPDVKANIFLKKNHTFRVRDTILDICNNTGLNKEDKYIAEACALLHDIGRFEQCKKYGTFSDAKSENHAAIGVRIIRKNNILKNFPSSARKIIIRSVGCHNMFSIPQNHNKDWIMFLKLLRDADKIDILLVMTEYYQNSVSGTNKVLELHLPDIDVISDAVCDPIVNRKIALLKNLKSLNDFKIYQMGWVYDLNFNRSLQIVKERKYLEIIRNALPKHSSNADKIYDITRTYLENKINAPLL